MQRLIREAIAVVNGAGATGPATTFQFGEFTICFRISGHGQLPALLRSIQHRRVEPASLAPMIDVVGGAQPHLEHLLPPSERRHERFLYNDERVTLFWAAEHNLTALDRDAGQGFVWYLAPDDIPSWEMGRPFLPLIKALTAGSTWTPAHAAAVARGKAGILILGASNKGKSSMALACLDAGWRYVGDDCVLLSGQPPRAATLYQTARVRLDMLPLLRAAVAATEWFSADSGEVRAEINVGTFVGVDIGDADIKAIVLPERNRADHAKVAPTTRSRALRALSATTLVMLPGAPVATHDILADIVQQVPCYTIDPGPEIAAVPGALAQLI